MEFSAKNSRLVVSLWDVRAEGFEAMILPESAHNVFLSVQVENVVVGDIMDDSKVGDLLSSCKINFQVVDKPRPRPE